MPIIKHYETLGLVKRVDAARGVDEVSSTPLLNWFLIVCMANGGHIITSYSGQLFLRYHQGLKVLFLLYWSLLEG